MTQTQLKRSLSFYQVAFYGLGTILGAGIYALVGKIAGQAGMMAPTAFLLAGVLAAFSAFSYAELSSRFPQSAGAANYIQQGFGIKNLSLFFGLGIALSGIVSAGTLMHAFVGYFQQFFPGVEGWMVMVALLIFMGALAWWGIQESAWLITIITLIEVGGLVLILWVARGSFSALPEALPSFFIPESVGSMGTMAGFLAGTFLAFYAFIGFEDMVNVAEETKNPTKVMPRAIIFALIGSTILYMGIAVVAVLTLAPADLLASGAPLADVFVAATGKDPVLITLIGLFAVINGVMAQIIMASRVLYGMSCFQWVPKCFSMICSHRQTPVFSIWVVVGIILFFALAIDMQGLATITSFITLTLFALVNLALWKVKRSGPAPKGTFVIWSWVPMVGFVANMFFVGHKVMTLLAL